MDDSIRRRRRLQPLETDLLLRVFEMYPRPNAPMRDLLAKHLGMSPRSVQIWFQNRRAKVKRDLVESGAMLLFHSVGDRGDLFSNIAGGTLDLASPPSPTDSTNSTSSFDGPEYPMVLHEYGLSSTTGQLEDLFAMPPTDLEPPTHYFDNLELPECPFNDLLV